MNRVGIKAVNAQGYESKFGIALHVQKPLEIGGGIHALMADVPQENVAVPTTIVLAEVMQALLTEAKNMLGFNEGEYTMFFSDQPNVPPSMPSVVLMAQANTKTKQQAAAGRELILGVCDVVNPSGTGQAELSPVVYANGYFNSPAAKIDYATARISIVQQPKHGHLEPDSGGDWRRAKYLPNDDYLGDEPLAIKNDSFIMKVEGNGYTVKIHYFVAVTDGVGVTFNPNPVCKGSAWKISSTIDANGNSTFIAAEFQSPTESENQRGQARIEFA